MRRPILLTLGLTLAAAAPVSATTFTRTPFAPDLGLDALTRSVTRERVARDLFSNPYATVTISNVDVYDRFPYLEARHFQVVSDPRWNRLVYGERGRSLVAYDGKTGALGALSEPRGLAVDEQGRVYVADTGNDRIVVLQATTEFGDIDLVPIEAIGGLSRPYGVAYSDGGTPFRPGDDYLYVADAGNNRVVAFALRPDGVRTDAVLGELGSGPGRFAGPLAVTVGRASGGNTRDVYVADAHNRRIARLRHEPGRLRWISDARHDADVVTSLDTDEWGNVYAAAPHRGVVRKFNADLAPVAELRDGLSRPRGLHVPFINLHDHRDGTVRRVGQPNAISVDEWSAQSGIAMWRLGVDVSDLRVAGDDRPSAHFALTDRARVTLEIRDAASGRSLARRTTGPLEAGLHDLPLLEEDLRSAAGASDPMLRVTALSSYPDGPSAVAQTRFRPNGEPVLSSRPMLLGNTPNPAAPFTRISYVLPASTSGRVSLRAFDALGRRVRTFKHSPSPGLNEVVWDGNDDQGRPVRGGVYFYRLEVGETRFTHSMVLVR